MPGFPRRTSQCEFAGAALYQALVALSKRGEIEREGEKREKGIESASWWMRSMRLYRKL